MSGIEVTGQAGIDTATAEIAVALRNACRVLCSDSDHYDEAMRLRDAIMAGTRALDARPAPEPEEAPHGYLQVLAVLAGPGEPDMSWATLGPATEAEAALAAAHPVFWRDPHNPSAVYYRHYPLRANHQLAQVAPAG